MSESVSVAASRSMKVPELERAHQALTAIIFAAAAVEYRVGSKMCGDHPVTSLSSKWAVLIGSLCASATITREASKPAAKAVNTSLTVD